MAETHDTIDGLLAEFRGYSYGMPPSYHVTMSWADFRKMLDRFEAAFDRERVETAARAAMQGVILTNQKYANTPVGDAAKLREAVKAVVDVGYPHNFQMEAPHIRGYCYDITEAIKKCFVALASPPRNCDVYNNESCRMAYHLHGDGLMTMQAFADWLFATATEKEGGAK